MMKKNHWSFLSIHAPLILAMSLMAISCRESDHQPVQSTLPTADKKSSDGKTNAITYDSHIQPLFKNRCSKCHYPGGPGPGNWLDYNTVSQKLSKIYQRVVTDKTMPLAPITMEPNERNLIAQWINAGAPKGSDDGTTNPTVPPTPSAEQGNNTSPPTTPPPITAPPVLIVPQTCTKDLSPALLAAVKSGQANDVDKLLTQGACANAKDEKDRGAILIAILDEDSSVSANKYTHIVESLMKAGADPNTSYNGGTALIWAIFNEVPDIATVLIKGGVNVNAMVEKGVDDTLASSLGFTPLMLAVQNIDYATVSILLANGADPLPGPKDGTTALKLADQLTDATKRDLIVKLLNLYLVGGDLLAPTFSHDIQKIFNDRCALCHNVDSTPKMNWIDYSIAYNKRALIYVRVVVKKDMPMANEYVQPITDNERELLAKWIRAGAPK